jgi:hypothetical protein
MTLVIDTNPILLKGGRIQKVLYVEGNVTSISAVSTLPAHAWIDRQTKKVRSFP